MTNAQATLILSTLPGMGPATVRKLLAKYGSPQAILEKSEFAPEATKVNLEKLQEKMTALKAVYIDGEHENYPNALRDLEDAPLGLYVRGTAPLTGVAIVGTRKPTEYGKRFAYELAFALAGRGVGVISGLALGIDRAAHEGALAAKGPTVAVLGTGVDKIYPNENAELFPKIAESGALVSEFALGKGPEKFSFPRRNRIVAAMATALVVVESDETGGAMITAQIAQKLGRKIFALPGRVDQTTSRGPHKLIQEGATLLTQPQEILDYLGNSTAAQLEMPLMAAAGKLSAADKKLIKPLIEGEPLNAEELCARAGLPLNEGLTKLMMLELEGHILKKMDGRYEKL